MVRFHDAYNKSPILYRVLIKVNTSEKYLKESTKKIVRVIYFEGLRDSAHNLMIKNMHAALFELYLIELFDEIFLQLRNQSSAQLIFFSQVQCGPQTRS